MPIRDVEDVVGAENYLRSQLADGTTIAHRVLTQVNLNRGKFRIAMPAAVDQSPPFDFKSAVLRMNHDEEELVAHVVRSFIAEPNCNVLMQDTELRRSDSFLDQVLKQGGHGDLVHFYQEELYWVVSGSELVSISDDEMLKLLKMASLNPFSAFLYRGTAPPPQMLTEGDLDQVLNGLVGLAVDALDFDSYLLWWRDDLQAFPSID